MRTAVQKPRATQLGSEQSPPTSGLQIGRTNDPAERDAEEVASTIADGRATRSQKVDPLGGSAAPRAVYDALSLPGHPLARPVRSALQPRFRTDLGSVRVHDDERANESARSIGANAYTVGRDIVFGAGRYQPSTLEGQRRIAHELAHVDQQAAAGISVQRDPAGDAPKAPLSMDEMLAVLEKEAKKPLSPKRREGLRKWAEKYQKKLGKPADLDALRWALSRWTFHNALPEIKTPAEVEAEKHKPPVPCDEIIPYKVGTKILVTHLFDKALPSDKADIVKDLAADETEKAQKKAGAKKKDEEGPRDLEGIIRAHPSAVFDLIMSKDVPKSATAVITKAGPELVEATIQVPTIPAKGGLPEYKAFTATMSLEYNTFMGHGYDLKLTRTDEDGETSSFMINELQISKTGSGIQVSVNKDEYFKVKIAKGEDGGLQLQVFEINTLAKLLTGVDDPLTLISVTPTGEQPAEIEKKQEDVRSSYEAPPATNRPQVFGGAGLLWTGRPEFLLSTGWRFTFSPGVGLLQVPLAFQLDYSPRADFFAGIHTGVEGTIPGQVPITLSLIGGGRAGSIELEDDYGGPGPRVPVLGPTWGLGLGVQLAEPITLQVDTSVMLNLLGLGSDSAPDAIGAAGLKTNLRF